MILDIGCGSNPIGHINIDIKYGYSKHHQKKDYRKNIPDIDFKNFILCSAEEIPLRAQCINTSYSSHCFEHLKKPLDALREVKRITKRKFIIILPNNPRLKKEIDTHFYSWSESSLKNFLGIVFNNVFVKSITNFDRIKEGRVFNLLINIAVFKRLFWRILEKHLKIELIGVCYL